MQIIRDLKYLEQLDSILDYIAQSGSINKSLDFLNKLDMSISKLTYMPKKFRKSYYYNDLNIRDMIFEGYTVPYLIDNDFIVILDIFKWEDR